MKGASGRSRTHSGFKRVRSPATPPRVLPQNSCTSGFTNGMGHPGKHPGLAAVSVKSTRHPVWSKNFIYLKFKVSGGASPFRARAGRSTRNTTLQQCESRPLNVVLTQFHCAAGCPLFSAGLNIWTLRGPRAPVPDLKHGRRVTLSQFCRLTGRVSHPDSVGPPRLFRRRSSKSRREGCPPAMGPQRFLDQVLWG